MSRIVTLDSSRLEAFEVGAILIATLAFPGRGEELASEKAVEALCADVLRETIAAFPENAEEWRLAFPRYTAIDKAESQRRLRTLDHRLQNRMLASRMALGFLEESITTRPAKLPAAMKRHSLNELSKLALSQSGENDSENLEARTWRASRPVIHLASAIQVLARFAAPDVEPFRYPLDDAKLHNQVIELAQFHEQKVLSDHRFGVRGDQLIRIRRRGEFA
jgi:hypothetical protein